MAKILGMFNSLYFMLALMDVSALLEADFTFILVS